MVENINDIYDISFIQTPFIMQADATFVVFEFGILNMLAVDEARALIKLKMDVELQWNDTRISADNPECTGAVADSEWDKIYRCGNVAFY